MKPRVYLETTIVSDLTARPSRTVLGAAHQQVTIDWWEQCRQDFDVVVSEIVFREAEAGDPEAARKRLAVRSEAGRDRGQSPLIAPSEVPAAKRTKFQRGSLVHS